MVRADQKDFIRNANGSKAAAGGAARIDISRMRKDDGFDRGFGCLRQMRFAKIAKLQRIRRIKAARNVRRTDQNFFFLFFDERSLRRRFSLGFS